MHIDIWSDVVCPWCHLGERRFRRALGELAWGDEVSLRFRAFQLDPGAPPEPTDLRVSLERKYGPGAFEAMTRRLSALGPAEGVDYRWDRVQRVNTFDAHRLLAWAGETDPPRQGELADRLFTAYFTDGADIADHPTLARVAGAAGLDDGAAATVLAEGSFAEHVRADRDAAHELDITGVPAFVIAETWVIPGAQDVDTFVSILERARSKL